MIALLESKWHLPPTCLPTTNRTQSCCQNHGKHWRQHWRNWRRVPCLSRSLSSSKYSFVLWRFLQTREEERRRSVVVRDGGQSLLLSSFSVYSLFHSVSLHSLPLFFMMGSWIRAHFRLYSVFLTLFSSSQKKLHTLHLTCYTCFIFFPDCRPFLLLR